MANVLNRSTLEYRKSVNTPEYDPAQWLINPALPLCERKYWKILEDFVFEMTAAEKAVVDVAELDAAKAAKREELGDLVLRKIVEERQDYQEAVGAVSAAKTIEELEAITLTKGL